MRSHRYFRWLKITDIYYIVLQWSMGFQSVDVKEKSIRLHFLNPNWLFLEQQQQKKSISLTLGCEEEIKLPIFPLVGRLYM